MLAMLSSSAVVFRACRRRTFNTTSRVTKSFPRLSSSSSSTTTTTTTTTAAPPTVARRPVRPTNITAEERAVIRAARKERAIAALQRAQGGGEAATTTTSAASGLFNPKYSRWMWYAGLGLPSILITWGIYDETSPPAKLAKAVGLADFIGSYTSQISAPVYDKLLPDWADMPDMPQDIPIPHTLVLDLEKTLVSSSWDRKYGWRHAKRPGVDKFLRDMAQYYEIVLYSPSIDGVAIPVVESLDKDGYIRHRLFRDATHYHNGVHVKDLKRLNRNIKRMVVIDDDLAEVQFNPENVIRVKPYDDPTDRTDDTLARITPFLIEIARENVQDVPAVLRQFAGMDADALASEHERRLQELQRHRQTHGLGSLRRGPALPEPELPPASLTPNATPQLTARQIAGQGPPGGGGGGPQLDVDAPGLMGVLNRRAKEKEEQNMRKLEKWNQVMLEKRKKEMERQQQQSV
uniref:Mitochondrial import inner membrane translocase subunit TIM50 n=1 Tax=Amphora coffeiformis TaxID=265554 RepID=A0A7S3L405_9STRA|mmetsp:Transcript_22674/g.43045  ORF Transcript_22674/g.43045 Transcript_22674/m.43045 type:complete len:462 (+) Transcript_22674:142-1527(+)